MSNYVIVEVHYAYTEDYPKRNRFVQINGYFNGKEDTRFLCSSTDDFLLRNVVRIAIPSRIVSLDFENYFEQVFEEADYERYYIVSKPVPMLILEDFLEYLTCLPWLSLDVVVHYKRFVADNMVSCETVNLRDWLGKSVNEQAKLS